MKKNKILTGIITGSLVLSFLVAPVYGASLNDQLAGSKARQAEAQYQVDLTQNTIDGISQEVDKVNAEINRINTVIEKINTEIQTLEANIAQKQQELAVAEAKRTEQENDMSGRVRTLYMYGNESILEFLFSAKDFSDFFAKLDMSKYIMSADKDALSALEETKKVIDDKKASIEADRLKTVEKRSEEETVLNQQTEIKAQKDELIAQNQAVVNEYAAIVESEAAMATEIEAQLTAYYAEQERLAAEAAAQQSQAGDGASNAGGGGSAAPDISYSTSGYVWPVSGPITSPFGYRTHPIFGNQSFHSGVDIGASSGTSVAAAGSGTVISAGWNGGYGNCVIIDMGNGVSSLYGHLSSIYVSSGQTVSAGQSIGAVGSTGNSTGPHLHFEMRSYGTAVNPYNYY